MAIVDGLVYHLPMNGNVVDHSGKAHVTTIANGPLQELPGKFGSALQFNGTNQSLSTPDTPDLNFNTGDFSLACWFYPSGFVTGQSLLSKNFGGNGPGYGARLINGSASLWLADGVAPTETLGLVFAVQNNQWYHYAATRKNGVVTVYINGIAGAPAVTNRNTDTSQSLVVGQRSGTGFFPGALQDVRVYSRALSPAEVMTLQVSGGASFKGGILYELAMDEKYRPRTRAEILARRKARAAKRAAALRAAEIKKAEADALAAAEKAREDRINEYLLNY